MNRARRTWMSVIIALLAQRGASAQDAWEYTPYQIQVYLLAAPGNFVPSERLQQIAAHLAERSDTVVGGGWKLQVDVAPPNLAAALAGGWEGLVAEEIPESNSSPDKVIVVSVAPGTDAGIEAREFDCRARQWGAVRRRSVTQPWRLPREAFLALTEAFAPLARIEPLENKQTRLRMRAGGMPPRDSQWQWTAPGEIFRCVLRVNEPSGKLRSVQEIAWTLLEVEAVESTSVLCHLETGIRGALTSRRGRFDLFALGLRPSADSTRLELLARTPDARPLAGYDVDATDRAATSIVRIGRTDRAGAITIPPGDGAYRILLIRDGQELLARLPMVPGAATVMTAKIPDDTQRLEVEAFVVGLQESVVDLVARRAVLLARVGTRLDANDLAEAEKLLEELRRMETREQLLQRIATERRRFNSSDPTVQGKIDRLFDETTQLLGQYLNPADIETLQRRLREARSAAASAK